MATIEPYSLVFYLGQAVVFWFISLVVYRRWFHPLANVPGPFLPAVTGLYALYFNVVKDGQFYKEIERLHSIYGPVVRITPREIHLSDPENYDKIYGVGGKFYKDPVFYGAINIPSAMFTTIPNELHRKRRAPLNPFFSRRAVLELEEVVQQKVHKFCQRVQDAINQKKPINLHDACKAISIDVFTQYAFDACYNSLDREDFGAWFSDMVRDSGVMFFTFQEFPIFNTITAAIPPWLAEKMSPNIKSYIQCKSQTTAQVIDTKKKIDAGIAPKQRTIFHQLLDTNASEEYIARTINDLVDESFAMSTAAADTTGNAMSFAAYNVVTNPNIYEALTKELHEAWPDPNVQLNYLALERLPYLTGVIKEAQRLSYGVLSRLPRITPEGGATFNGYTVPAGTSVSMSSWMMHRNHEAFPSPDVFDPTRWLDTERSHLLEKFMVPFSRGGRMCIGINLAHCEMYLTLGTLFRRFGNLKAFDVGPEDMVYEDYFSAYHPANAKRFKVVEDKP